MTSSGSSPRVRGTRNELGNQAIPCTDHPRVCGELQHDGPNPITHVGSSPRVRGTPGGEAVDVADNRIIPACAGNSGGDRPRRSICCGSSPRVRGTLGRCQRFMALDRIIPACAGNSRRSATGCPSVPDHPRVCGELAWQIEQFDRATGSSPRVRGTPRRRRGLHPPRRIIPACAGNSVRFAARQGLSADHPRVCGELLGSSITYAGRGGSSPRVRGTPGVQYHIRG